MKDLIENKHRADDPWFRRQLEAQVEREAAINAAINAAEEVIAAKFPPGFSVPELIKVKIDTDKLPSKEEVLEQGRLMKEYEDEIVAKAAAEKDGTQAGQTGLTPIITPQGE